MHQVVPTWNGLTFLFAVYLDDVEMGVYNVEMFTIQVKSLGTHDIYTSKFNAWICR